MDITLERYHGLGNDYLVYDPNKNELELNEENVKMLCNRNMGLGADIIMLDNMDDETMKEAVKLIDGRAETECSGNVV